MQYAVIDRGVVTNKILWDGIAPWEPPFGCIAIQLIEGEVCDIGWSYDPDGDPRFRP